MRKVTAYNFLTLNGFFKGPDEDISWHQHGGEEAEYSQKSLSAGSILLFGRKTYELMRSFWPTPMARAQFPQVAEGMNRAEKIVFSHEFFTPDWENTRVLRADIVEEIRKLKATPGKDMTILGSGTIINLFTEHELIDEYEFMIDPVVLPDGTPVLSGSGRKRDLKLTDFRRFKSGAVLLRYQLSRD